MIASRRRSSTPLRTARAFWGLFAVGFAALGATPVSANSVVGVSMTDPSTVSDTAGGELDYSQGQRWSDDGRWLVFRSQGTDLVPGYTGHGFQVYLYDRLTATVTLVSRHHGSVTQGANDSSQQPVISDDGAFVAFQSSATDLVAGGSGPGFGNIYLWERASGATTLVSQSAAVAGRRGDGDSFIPVLSGDGTSVAYCSSASDLISPGSGPLSSNVYLWDRFSGTTTLVTESVGAPGQRADGSSYWPVISDDGNYVAFESTSTDLVVGESGPANSNIYFWSRVAGTMTLVSESISSVGQRGNSSSFSPSISGDGAYLVFYSSSSDLVSGGSGPTTGNLYLWERASGSATLISQSVAAAGRRGNGSSVDGMVSGDGAYVAFYSNASDLVLGGSGPATGNVYLWERVSGATTLVSESTAAANQRGNGYSYSPSISSDGSLVAFHSDATDLVPAGSGLPYRNAYVWSRLSGMRTLISESMSAANQRGNGYSESVLVSGDGSCVAFQSGSSDLVPNDSAATDVFVAEVGASSLVAASRRDIAVPYLPMTGNGSNVLIPSSVRSISDDGGYVTFYSSSQDLTVGESGPIGLNVYLWERSSGVVTLVSESAAAAGQRGYGNSQDPVISGDGAYVVFVSTATDLVPGEAGPTGYNVYLWERSTRTTTLLSESSAVSGQRANASSYASVVSVDGSVVAFLSFATDLEAGGCGPATQNVHLWERATGATRLVSASPLGCRANSNSTEAVVSGDGAYVAYSSSATDLVTGGGGPSGSNVYLWNRLSATPT